MNDSDDFDRRDHIQSIERALAVITAFSHAGPFLSLGDLASATGLTKQTVRRILMTLERLGYASSVEYRWALTPRVLSLGYAYLSSVDLPAAAQPVMETLTDDIGEGTSLATLDITDVVYINRVQRQRITRINLAVGTRLPAHATSMGHVLLSALSPKELDHYFESAHLDALTHHTLTTREELADRLAAVGERGWDVVDQELELGRRSAAAPVRDAENKVVAALSVSCSSVSRSVDDIVQHLIPTLVAAAQQISVALGAGEYTHRASDRRIR